jgi:hypothetical protein
MSWPDPFEDTPETEHGKRVPSPTRRIRSSSAYRTLVREYRTYCAAQRNSDGTVGLPCALCFQPIDYRLPHWSPWAFQAHHDLSIADRPDLILSLANFRPAHARCNNRHGRGPSEDTDDMAKLLGAPSETW